MSAKEAEICIRKLPVCVAYDSAHDLYNLRRKDTSKTPTMPDACLAIEKDGIYFCDNLSADSHNLLAAFIAILKPHFDVVTIDEL
jgi:hypothetical protein